MALKIGTLEGERVRMEQRLWQTADRTKLVLDGDPEAAFLFCVPGGYVSLTDAKRYGLVEDEGSKKPEKKSEK